MLTTSEAGSSLPTFLQGWSCSQWKSGEHTPTGSLPRGTRLRVGASRAQASSHPWPPSLPPADLRGRGPSPPHTFTLPRVWPLSPPQICHHSSSDQTLALLERRGYCSCFLAPCKCLPLTLTPSYFTQDALLPQLLSVPSTLP